MRLEDYLERDFKLVAPLKKDGKDYKKIVIRELGGPDEEHLGQEKFKKDYHLFLATAISRAIAEVKDTEWLPDAEDILELPLGEIDRLSAELRFLTLGDTYTHKGICVNPDCKSPLVFDFSREDIIKENAFEFKKKKVTLRKPIKIKNKDGEEVKSSKVSVSPITGKAQASVLSEKVMSGKSVNEGAKKSELIHYVLEDEFGNKIDEDTIKNMTKFDRAAILESITADSVLNLTQEFECPNCGEAIDININILDFLLS